MSKPNGLDTTFGIAINDNKKVDVNSHVSNYSVYKRGTIYLSNGNLKCERIYNILDEVKGPIDFAISGLMLYPSYNPTLEGYIKPYDDILRKTTHTALGFNKDKVYLIASSEELSLVDFKNKILNSKIAFQGLISLDGGGSTQLNYDGIGINSIRKIGTAVVLKEI